MLPPKVSRLSTIAAYNHGSLAGMPLLCRHVRRDSRRAGEGRARTGTGHAARDARPRAARQSGVPGGRKSFLFFRTPRADPNDPTTGKRFTDVIVFWVASESEKHAPGSGSDDAVLQHTALRRPLLGPAAGQPHWRTHPTRTQRGSARRLARPGFPLQKNHLAHLGAREVAPAIRSRDPCRPACATNGPIGSVHSDGLAGGARTAFAVRDGGCLLGVSGRGRGWGRVCAASPCYPLRW